MREIEGFITHEADHDPDLSSQHPVRASRFVSEWGFLPLTSDHTDDEEKSMCDALRRCFGGDVDLEDRGAA